MSGVSPNRIALWPDAQGDILKTLDKSVGSDNVCYIVLTNRNQTHHLAGRPSNNRTTAANFGARFWKKVEQRGADECWPWLGGKLKNGRGQMRVPFCSTAKNPRLFAYVIAWMLAHGCDVPQGEVIRHECDNPNCCNPNHLLSGTQRENVHDSIRRGKRNAFGRQKLTLPDVSLIRTRAAAGETYKGIAASYGITPNTVSSIVNGHSWKHHLCVSVSSSHSESKNAATRGSVQAGQ